MKLAYVNLKPSLGVLRKLAGQQTVARRQGLDLDVVALVDEIPQDNQEIKFRKLNFPKNWFFRRMADNFFRFRYIDKALDLSVYDRIILRYPGSTALQFSSFFRKHRNKIILEFHSDFIEELKKLEEGVLNPLRIYLERNNSPKLISLAAGIIAVTNELRERYAEIAGNSVPSYVVSNGIDVENVSFTGFQPYIPGSGLKILFVSGTFYPWHGLDRLLRGLALYDGDERISLRLVGKVHRTEELDLIRDFKHQNIKIEVLASQASEDLDGLFQDSNVAVSSLAIFRNNMKEACVLKTREYTARGIPFVYAYDDVDLDEECSFSLKIEASDEPVDIAEVLEFSRRISSIEGISQKMRSYALDRMDWSEKVKEMYDFAQSLNNEPR